MAFHILLCSLVRSKPHDGRGGGLISITGKYKWALFMVVPPNISGNIWHFATKPGDVVEKYHNLSMMKQNVFGHPSIVLLVFFKS